MAFFFVPLHSSGILRGYKSKYVSNVLSFETNVWYGGKNAGKIAHRVSGSVLGAGDRAVKKFCPLGATF